MASTARIYTVQDGRPALAFPPVLLEDTWDPDGISWKITDCIENHACGQASTPELPTRLLDIGRSDNDSIKLVLTTDICSTDHDRDIRYAALSYCWGSAPSLLTTSQNLASRLEGIPLHMMPQTLADAVTVTRQLGIHFLWIDAMCILQGARTTDSEAYHDWKRESARMASVYGNAFVTMVAAGAPGSQHGLRYAWPFPCRRSKDIEYLDAELGDESGAKNQPWSRKSDDGLGVNMGSEAISSRAWALQEWLLSRRLLVFATTGVYFVCDKRPLPTTNLLYSLRLVHPGSRAWMSTKIGFVNLWQRIVINFCARDLTDPADKLPALSGLVEAYSRTMGWPQTDCVAGLWRGTIVKDLLWIRASMNALPSTQQSGRQPNRAPSWSWASIDGNITYLELPKRWCRLRGTTTLYKATVHAEVKICNEMLSPTSGEEAFGQVVTCGLFIRCRYLQAVIGTSDLKPDKKPDAPFQEWNAVSCNLGPASLPEKYRARIVWDDPVEFEHHLDPEEKESGLLKSKLYFLSIVQLVRDGQTRWVGLVVRFSECDHAYRRLGLFQCLWPGLFQESKHLDFKIV